MPISMLPVKTLWQNHGKKGVLQTMSVMIRRYPALFLCVFLAVTMPCSARAMSLEDVIDHVYEHSPSVAAARAERDAIAELYPQAMAGWHPSLSAETGIYKTKIDNSNFAGATGTTTKEIGLHLEQPLFRGGRTMADTARARHLIRASQADYHGIRQDIILRTVTVYMDVIRDRALHELHRANRRRLQAAMDAAEKRFAAGAITRTDINQATMRLSRAQADEIAADNDLAGSLAAFAQLTGFPAPEDMTFPSERLILPDTLQEALAIAERDHPSLHAAQAVEKAAQADIKTARSATLPQIDAYATYNRQYDPQPGLVNRSESKTAGLRATMALYQGGAVRSRIREAAQQARRHQYDTTHHASIVARNVETHWHHWQAARREAETRRREIDAARDARDGVEAETAMGARTVLDMLDAEQELLNARTALTRARRNKTVESYTLLQRIGHLHPHPAPYTPPSDP